MRHDRLEFNPFMSGWDRFWRVIFLLIVMALALVSLTGCGPSCEERGGKTVFDGYFYVWQWIDVQKGIGYMQPYPQYKCVGVQ